ncbi:MAG: prephenate dehydrogenase/arogenate dehydrogenase family protein [Burkholderiales bacterium]|jgi:prephenate dehydrogenase|nr:prephenate dehydrogenase/arogenate dehydrogenase family protein [Burkholderiales bacterium]
MPVEPNIDTLVVAGVGLIGGSFALALKQAGAVRRVVGLGRTRASLERAAALGVIDEAADDPAHALAHADLVMLAMPVGQTVAVLERIAPHLRADAVVTDAGSTKRDVIDAARAVLKGAFPRFVPGHPIAGAESSGADAARADLFRGRKTVLTPLAVTDARAVARVAGAWRACGADVREMPAEEHDAVFAAVSHLPHLLAFALVHELAEQPNAATLFDYAAGGFRDFTRIASSHPEMWRDICLANRECVGEALARYRSELDRLQRLLAAGDAEAIERTFAEARAARNAWLARIESGERK